MGLYAIIRPLTPLPPAPKALVVEISTNIVGGGGGRLLLLLLLPPPLLINTTTTTTSTVTATATATAIATAATTAATTTTPPAAAPATASTTAMATATATSRQSVLFRVPFHVLRPADCRRGFGAQGFEAHAYDALYPNHFSRIFLEFAFSPAGEAPQEAGEEGLGFKDITLTVENQIEK